MTWDYYGKGDEFILKEKKKSVNRNILDSLSAKQRKALKKTLQASEPTEFFGQDFTKLGDLIDALQELDMMKSDKKLNKKIKGMGERNIDIVATATKLRKEYELLYRQLRDLIYPKGKEDKK
jgi:hypothetical protein